MNRTTLSRPTDRLPSSRPADPRRAHPTTRRTAATLVAAAALVLVLALALGALSACSTSGRELREPAARAPVLAPATSSSASVSASSQLIEGLDGFALTSPQFLPGGTLPVESGALAGNRSPALTWTSTPASATELALVVSDPTGASVYWLVTGIAAEDAAIAPGTAPAGATVHPNSAGHSAYDGPIVVSGASTSVVFRLYALAQPVQLGPELPPDDAVRSIAAASFATATMSAVYTDDDTRPQAS